MTLEEAALGCKDDQHDRLAPYGKLQWYGKAEGATESSAAAVTARAM
ncbi:MAG: hypothetical protein ACLU0O_04460 [Collinsella sp.]